VGWGKVRHSEGHRFGLKKYEARGQAREGMGEGGQWKRGEGWNGKGGYRAGERDGQLNVGRS
jgi:hypothetical protein